MSGTLFPINITAPQTQSEAEKPSSTAGTSGQRKLDWLENTSYENVIAQKEEKASADIEVMVDQLLSTARKQTAPVKQQSQASGSREKERRRKEKSVQSTKRKEDSRKPLSKELQSSKSVFLEDVRIPAEKAFRIDRKHDRNNLAFPSLYHLHVAVYDKNKVLNARKRREENKGRKRETKRYFQSSSLKNSGSAYFIEPKISTFTAQSYIPIVANVLSSHNNDNEDSQSVYDYATSQYVKGKGVSSTSQDPVNLQFSSLSEGKSKQGPRKISAQQIVHDKTQELNRHLRDHPYDVQKWMDFIEFQDKAMATEKKMETSAETLSSKSALWEKKLSIVEKALEYNPKSVELGVVRLEILREFRDHEKVSEEWNKFIFLNPNVPYAWQRYILFTKSNVTYFSVPNVIKAFIKCISTFRKMLEGHFQSHKAPDNLEDEILLILLMFTEFLENVGHIERALATWQAIIEFNLFTPSHLQMGMPLQDWFAFFEPFWDSSVPRFGEENAKGWAHVMEKKLVSKPEPSTCLDAFEDEIIAKRYSRSKTWLLFEDLRDRYNWLPGGDSEVEHTDTVYFDDIEPVLIRFKKQDSKVKLLRYFFKYLRAAQCLSPLPQIYINSIPHLLSVKSFYINTEERCTKKDYVKFILNCFESSTKLFGSHQIDIIQEYIQYQIRCIGSVVSAKQVRKSIKNFLKQDPNNLLLWELYATFEQEHGNMTEALRVYETAIKAQYEKDDKVRFLTFLKNYVECALRLPTSWDLEQALETSSRFKESDSSHTLKVLLEGILGKSQEVASPATLLRAKRSIATLKNESDGAATVVCLLQSFLYFLSSDEDEAFKTLETFLATSTTGRCEESIFEVYVKLRFLHWQKKFVHLSLLHDVLARAMWNYPNNNFFMLIYINLESKVAVASKIRKFFSTLLKTHPFQTPRMWLFAIYSELRRLEFIEKGVAKDEASTLTNGIIFKIRSLFEKAVCCKDVRHSALIWRLYISFEMRFGNTEKARAAYYRAVQSCPWVKALYMDGICYFPSVLQETLDVMNEKEIRIRTPIEEVDLLLENLIKSEQMQADTAPSQGVTQTVT